MPNVLVNDRPLLQPTAGIGIYLRNILANWPAGSDVRLTGFWRPGLDRDSLIPPPGPLGPLTWTRLPDLPWSRIAGRRWPWAVRRVGQKVNQWQFRRRFRAGGHDCSWEPNHLAIPTGGPTVTTVHDLSVLERPQWHPADRVAYWKAQLDASLACTTRWIADSAFTARRMTALLSIDAAKITTIPLAGRPLDYPSREDLPARLAALGAPAAVGESNRYFLHLGTLEPRKNIKFLLDAYALLPQSLRKTCPLVLAGGIGWGGAADFEALTQHPIAGEVFWAGYVSDTAAAVLLAGAAALLTPSHYEGFGLPILEAFGCGTPVICSGCDAFVEIARDAAAVLNIADAQPWAAAMQRVLEDENWGQNLSRAGKMRVAQYSWATAAKKHADVLSQAGK